MFVLTLISIVLALMLLDLTTRPRLEGIDTGNSFRSAMTDMENPGHDWLGKWW